MNKTKQKNKPKFLKDKIASIIFTDEDTREFTEFVVAKTLNIALEDVKGKLTLITPRVNSNVNVQYSEVDAVYENDDCIINIEINMSKYDKLDVKNMKYVGHLLLKQTKINEEYPDLKKVNQININYFDVFNADKFIYRSSLMEETLHLKRADFVSIIDINLDFLSKMDYTKIMEGENSLEKLLYVFVCNNKEILAELYSNNEIMEKVVKKISALTEDFDQELYYDREALHNEILYDMGLKDGVKKGISQGIQQNKREIATAMLKKNMSDSDIIEITGLTKEQLESLK